MKKVITNRLIAIVLSIVCSISLTSTAMANNDEPTVAVEFKFVGKIDNQPVFQLKLTNVTNAENYTVTIEDDNSYVLHKAAMKAGTQSLNFILSDDVENVPLRFNIYDKVNNKTFVYVINQRTQIENKFLITKL